MDLVRTLPKIDRTRFQVSVCTFLARGELGKVLQDQGIDVIGPLSASFYRFRQIPRRIAQLISTLLWVPLAGKLNALRRSLRRMPLARELSALRRLVRRIARPMSQLLTRATAGLRYVVRLCCKPLQAFYSLRAIAYLADVVRLARPIAAHIRASDIDVIHTILPNSYLVGACASALAGRRPILMSRLSLNLYQQEYRLLGFMERRILHRIVGAAIGNSQAVLRDLKAEGIRESKLHLVYNGMDARAFADQMVDRATARRLLDISDDALVFSVVANLYPYKGHEDLLAALAALSKDWSDWSCLLVGKDVHDRLPELNRLCLGYGLSRNVKFLGPRRDIPVILSASDIHISASHQEGLPNNIIEAMCARLPVVATAVGGVPELVVDGQTGYLLPPQDAARMSAALLALARSPSLRKAFGEAGYARAVSHFNMDNNVVAFETIYAGLSGGSPHGRRLPRWRGADLRTLTS